MTLASYSLVVAGKIQRGLHHVYPIVIGRRVSGRYFGDNVTGEPCLGDRFQRFRYRL